MALRCSDSPGGATHLGSRVACEQDRLLGVGAECAGDDEVDAVLARRRRHAVERLSDVRPHRLALPMRERPVVAAAAAEQRRTDAGGRGELGLRVRAHPDRLPAIAIRRSTATRIRTGANVAPSGKRDGPRRRPPFAAATRAAAARPSSRYASLREMARVRPAARPRRLEQPVVRVVHRPRAAERGEIGGALRGVARAEPARDRAEHERAERDREQPADEQHGDLPADATLGGAPAGRRAVRCGDPRHALHVHDPPARRRLPANLGGPRLRVPRS